MSKLSRAGRSRINGAKSKGPVTIEGKAASSRNAFQHGFCGSRVHIMEFESTEEYDHLRDCYMHRFQPNDQIEADRIEQMVDAVWRRRRLITIETTLIDTEVVVGAQAVEDAFIEADGHLRVALAFQAKHGDNAFAMLHRYITAVERSYTRGLNELRLLQGARFEQNQPPPALKDPETEAITERTRKSSPARSSNKQNPSPGAIPEKIAA